MEQQIERLVTGYSEGGDVCVELLPVSGSARKYYRVHGRGETYIAVYHENFRENQLFVEFTNHFRRKGLHVPEIYRVSEDGLSYLQEDLGRDMLLDVLERERDGELLSEHVMMLYRKALLELLRFQRIGGEGLDYSNCLPRPAFDERCMRWDLNYFKYCFLRLARVDFDEERLENDFDRLVERLRGAGANYFLFRDFQSRNIMVPRDEVYFIDYQGGRRGALPYDVASLLYDAIAQIPEIQRRALLDFYLERLAACEPGSVAGFREVYDHFVLIRLLQALGAFGLRGLYEGKEHFVQSIVPGLQGVIDLLVPGRLDEEYPEIQRVVRMAFGKYFVPSRVENNE